MNDHKYELVLMNNMLSCRLWMLDLLRSPMGHLCLTDSTCTWYVLRTQVIGINLKHLEAQSVTTAAILKENRGKPDAFGSMSVLARS